MYVYQVTNLPTREFYIGLSKQPKSTFEPTKITDPAGMFTVMGTNGSMLRIHNCEKRIIAVVDSVNELSKLGAEYSKKYQNDPAFKGLHNGDIISPKPKVQLKQKPKVTTPTLKVKVQKDKDTSPSSSTKIK